MIGWISKFASAIADGVKNIINEEIEQMNRYYGQLA